MILGPVSLLDCMVFCLFLTPQLLWRVGFLDTLLTVVQAVPFLCKLSCPLAISKGKHRSSCSRAVLRLPVEYIRERYFHTQQQQSPFVRQASAFEDFVIRCVRYAFANFDPKIGRVFFSKEVALPFLRFRLLRHGYLRPPLFWREINGVSPGS
jgi:hypothetical protein